MILNSIVDVIVWGLTRKRTATNDSFAVVLSVNDNDEYCKYWPLVYSAWKNLVGVNVWCAYVGTKSGYMTSHADHVIHYPHVAGIDDVLLSQIARIYLATQIHNIPVLISDIDMFPLQKSYFYSLRQQLTNSKCIIASNDGYPDHRYPMCYILFDSNIGKQVINPRSLTFEQFAHELFSVGHGWDTDEKWLTMQIDSSLPDSAILRLNRQFRNGISRRIDRSDFVYSKSLLVRGYYVDMHMPKDPVDSVNIAKKMYSQIGVQL